MVRTKAQIQLQYHQALNRICEMELLADQMQRLADSYQQQSRERMLLRETSPVYQSGQGQPEDTLREQSRELQSVAEAWYEQAKTEYDQGLLEIQLKDV